MNPFDLRGPEFLLFYVALAAITFVALHLWRRRAESTGAAERWLREPYLVAGLRGGEEEIARVAVLSLLTRRVLSRAGGNRVGLATTDPPRPGDPLERAVVEAVAGGPRLVSAVVHAAPVRTATRPHLEQLRARGLLATEAQQRARVLAATLAGGLLVSVAAAKVAVALSRGRTNVLFLVLLAGACVWGCVAFARRAARTRAGDEVLRTLRTLVGRRRAVATASTFHGGHDPELLLLAAVGGIAGSPFAPARKARQQEAGGSCGAFSSCSGSCGGGGCGGGCGGCGA